MAYDTHWTIARVGSALLLLGALAPDVARSETARASLGVTATVIGCRASSRPGPTQDAEPRPTAAPVASVACPAGIPYEVRFEPEVRPARSSSPQFTPAPGQDAVVPVSGEPPVTIVTIVY